MRSNAMILSALDSVDIAARLLDLGWVVSVGWKDVEWGCREGYSAHSNSFNARGKERKTLV